MQASTDGASEDRAARLPLRSFWMGGYEGADHRNVHGLPLDMAAASGHWQRLERDHLAAAARGIRTVRESVGWRLCEPDAGRVDLRRVRRIAASARSAGVQVVWTLMHYGMPPDLDLHDDRLIDRFASFAASFAREIGDAGDGAPPVVNPINEISFLSWAATETATFGPPSERDPAAFDDVAGESSLRSGYAVKRRLVRAVLAAVEAIRRVEPRTRFLHVEPLVHVVPPTGRPDLQALADRVASYQWQTWDLIGGLAEPALGGSAEVLDMLGVNHYHSGQWEVLTERRLLWHERDARRRPFAAQLADAWRRYGRPIVVAETSHFGDGRAAWLEEVVVEVLAARRAGVPVGSVCLYPLVDRPDWNDLDHWHHSGLWDHAGDVDAPVLAADYARGFERCRARFEEEAGPVNQARARAAADR
jgi:Glycosyl hydrolase family 1